MKISQTDWAQMPYFLAVARSKSLRQAAKSLGTTHLKVNRHLQALEAAFGVELIHRTQGGIKLTQAGETLLPIAQEAEGMFIQAQRTLHGLDNKETGVVRLSVSGPIGYRLIAPILTKFTALYPGIETTLSISTAHEDHRLIETDVAIRMVYDVHEDAIVRKLFPIGLGMFASKSYIERELPNAGPGGEGLTCIGFGAPNRRPNWAEETIFPNAQLCHWINDPMMHLELARAGAGIVRLASFLTVDEPELVMVPGTETEVGPPLCMIIHPELRKTTRVRRFVDFFEAELRALRPMIEHGERR